MEPDHVDQIVEQWSRQRPKLDVSAMAIIGRISRLNKTIGPQLAAVFAEHGLESWEFDVLATLVRNGPPHQMTAGQLLDWTMVTSGAMTNRIDRLEKRGLVKRTKSPSDRRQVMVTLTPAGAKVVDDTLVDHTANESAMVAGLTKRQQRELVRLLRLLHHSVNAQAERANRSRASPT